MDPSWYLGSNQIYSNIYCKYFKIENINQFIHNFLKLTRVISTDFRAFEMLPVQCSDKEFAYNTLANIDNQQIQVHKVGFSTAGSFLDADQSED